MADLMWIQGTTPALSYTATEDRRVLGTIFTPGVVHGCDLTAGVGLVQVAAGTVAISDQTAFGVYLAPYGGGVSSQVAVTTAGTYKIYAVANTTNGQAELLATTSTTAPTAPYAQLGTAVVAVGGAITVSTTGKQVSDLRAVTGEYFPKLATTDTTAVSQGGVTTWSQAHNFQSTVRATGGLALGPSAAALVPGGITWSRSKSVGAGQHIDASNPNYEVVAFELADYTLVGANNGMGNATVNGVFAPTTGYYVGNFRISGTPTVGGNVLFGLSRGGVPGGSNVEILDLTTVNTSISDHMGGATAFVRFSGRLTGSTSPIVVSCWNTASSGYFEVTYFRGSWGQVPGMNF